MKRLHSNGAVCLISPGKNRASLSASYHFNMGMRL